MKVAVCLLVCAAAVFAEDMGVLRKSAENKFEPMAGLPPCVTLAVENGDPSNGPSTILFKGAAGCMIPWHWHTPTEQVMIVTGTAKVEMRDGEKAANLGPGGYAMMPSKHVHRFTCSTECSAFVNSDAAFDIHYVDENGKEISAETATRKKR